MPLSIRLQTQHIFARNKVPLNSLGLMTKEVTERSNYTVAILKHAEQEMSSSKSSETFWIKSAERLHARLAHTMICQQMMGLSRKRRHAQRRKKALR